MRTEYHIVQTERNGKKHDTAYPKKYVMEHYLSAKKFYEAKGWTVELFKVVFNGVSIYHAEKIEEV